MGRKMKNQKVKTKPTEGRKQLGSVRVIQRNLVYVVGLPLNLADEDVLQRRDYFGQYGKVLKVSISRTAAGTIQQFQNSTCSVYITYTKEEEAIRCIQNVHGFVLDDRPLRACFGTTKYCHAWLRNMPCNNADCLYLHEVGSQEDSFTKDEIISSYTRSRVQQVTGAANNVERRSGNLLPPPLDDYANKSSGKPSVKNASSNLTNATRGSPPNGSLGRSIVLPAGSAWGARGSSSHPPVSGAITTNVHLKSKPDTNSCMLSFSSAVADAAQPSVLHSDAGKQSLVNDETHHSSLPKSKTELLLNQPVSNYNESNAVDVPVGESNAGDVPVDESNAGDVSVDESSAAAVVPFSHALLPKEIQGHEIVTVNNVIDPDEYQGSVSSGEEIQKLCSDLSLIDADKDDPDSSRLDGLAATLVLVKSTENQGSQQQIDAERSMKSLVTAAGTSASPIDGLCASTEQLFVDSDSQLELLHGVETDLDDDVLSFDNQRLNDPEIVCHSQYLSNSALNPSNHRESLNSEPYNALRENVGSVLVDNRNLRPRNGSLFNVPSVVSDGYSDKFVRGSSFAFDRTVLQSLSLKEIEQGFPGRFIGETTCTGSNAALNKGESSIITDILSMDFQPWEDSLTSPHNLAKLLSDAEEHTGPLKVSNSSKAHSNSQSKFSFARQQEEDSQSFVMQRPLSVIEQLSVGRSNIQDFVHRDLHNERIGTHNNFSSSNINEFENLSSSHVSVSSNKLPAISKTRISVPPGFSVPKKPPPPGFPSQGRKHQAFDSMSGNPSIDASLQNYCHTLAHGNGNNSTVDIEFMDPAILAVGKGRIQGAMNNVGLHMRSNVSPQLNTIDEAALQLLMQRSVNPQQNLGVPELANSFPHLTDSYGISSRFLHPSQVSNLSPLTQVSLQQSENAVLSNGRWDGWNEVQGHHRLGVADLLNNDRLGYNKFYGGYDDAKFRMTSSSHIYDRTFGL